MNNPIVYNITIGRSKPENFRQKDTPCPFCNREALTDILDREGPTIWLMNKYPVLQDCWQTVIIETDDCHSEFSMYSPEEAERILRFSINKWRETIASGRFKSVLYFKNFGPMSGGSLRHPHSQIVGLLKEDYREEIKPFHFEGWTIADTKDLKVTLSKTPIIGFFEFNIIAEPSASVKNLSRYIQGILSYIRNDFSKYSTSYNIFFYHLNDALLYVKIVPRYLTSPLFVGYKLSQVCNEERAREVIRDLRRYLP